DPTASGRECTDFYQRSRRGGDFFQSFHNPWRKTLMTQNTDIVVIGAGIAGMTAAVYAVRAGKRVTVLECEAFGGQISASPRVENYPGIPAISGTDLSDALYQQASGLGVEFAFARAQSIAPQADGGFVVESDAGPYACR